MSKWIKNFDDLAVTENRRLALQVVEAGFDAIDTEKIIKSSVKFKGSTLTIKNKKFDLGNFKRIKVIGFGKASCQAAAVLDKILGSKIQEGIVIGIEKTKCEYIETYEGTHPRPSLENVEITRKIFKMSQDLTKEDLVIVIASGGGSALLCLTEEEYKQGQRLYDESLKHGVAIKELNTVRKHLSFLKGGGLAKTLYPATVVSLIFSDVPGEHYEQVASGPTFKDKTTIKDAQEIIDEYSLGKFDLTETPKENKYFDKVRNIILVSNKIALEAMAEKAKKLGLNSNIISAEIYDLPEKTIEKFTKVARKDSVILGAGEPRLEVKGSGGSGGRNLFLGMKAVRMIDENSVFISFASDGMDNSDMAGAIVDKDTLEKTEKMNLDLSDYINRYDAYAFFEKLGDLIFTGPTNANVSDLMLLLTKK